MKHLIRPSAKDDILRQYRYYLLEVVRVLHGKRDIKAILAKEEGGDDARN